MSRFLLARRMIRWGPRALLLIALFWLVAAGWQLRIAWSNIDSALDSLSDARAVAASDLDGFVQAATTAGDDLEEEMVSDRLHAAALDFSDARAAVQHPAVRSLRVVPVLGRQLQSVDALASSASIATNAGAEAFEDLSALLSEDVEGPERRVSVVAEVAARLKQLQSDLRALDLGPASALVGPLGSARDRFATEYETVLAAVSTAVDVAEGSLGFLDGPSRYLLMAANNGEMRAGSGMFLQVGVLEVEDGRFHVGDMVPARELLLPESEVAMDPDVDGLWGWLRPNQEWRNVNLTPRFDVSAAMASDMWEAAGGEPVDGVIALDVVALERLLEALGPVDVEGETITSEGVVADLLLDQYATFEGERDQRRERLGLIASAVFEAMSERSWAPTRMLEALESAGSGRHLLIWSDHDVQARAWDAVGVSGTIESDSMLLSVINRGGNKLDQFLEVSSEVDVSQVDDLKHVSVDVRVRNSTPEGLVRYVAGPHPRSPVGAGEYLGIVSLTLPGLAGSPEVSGGAPAALGPDGDSYVLAAWTSVEPGAESVVTFEFDLAPGVETIQVLPSARVPAVEWAFDGQTWVDDSAAWLELEEPRRNSR